MPAPGDVPCDQQRNYFWLHLLNSKISGNILGNFAVNSGENQEKENKQKRAKTRLTTCPCGTRVQKSLVLHCASCPTAMILVSPACSLTKSGASQHVNLRSHMLLWNQLFPSLNGAVPLSVTCPNTSVCRSALWSWNWSCIKKIFMIVVCRDTGEELKNVYLLKKWMIGCLRTEGLMGWEFLFSLSMG